MSEKPTDKHPATRWEAFHVRWRQISRRSWLILGLIAMAGSLLQLLSIIADITGSPVLDLLKTTQSENADITQRLRDLDQVSASLKDLQSFIDDQEQKLVAKQEIITQLEAEEAQLKPIVEAERETVDAILELQDSRTRRDRWKDVVSGILISITIEITIGVFVGPWLLRKIRKGGPETTSRPPEAPTPDAQP